jgi:hypothetical protein
VINRVSPSTRRAVTALLVAIVCGCPAGVGASQLKRIFGSDGNVKYERFKDPGGRFEIDYPAKDWKRLPVGSSLVAFARSEDATLSVDHVTLLEGFSAAELEGMPAVELAALKEQQPRAKDFKSDMVDSKAGRGVLIRYARAGAGPETAFQFSIPVGRELFRINAAITDKQLAKYEPIVMYMIQSFMATVKE